MTNVDAVHQVICAHDTNAFFIVEVVFEGIILLMGCVLAFKTRNLQDEFGEAKQLILAMYNIAVVCSVVVVLTNFMSSGQAGSRLLYAVGIFWVTIFSSCVFIIPRLLEAYYGISGTRTSVSGFRASSVPGRTPVSGHNKSSATERT